MNSLKMCLLSPKTAMNLILAQISYTALLAYLCLLPWKTGGKKSRSADTGDISRAVSACKFVRAKHIGSSRVTLTGALRVVKLRLFPFQLIVILHN